MSSNEHTRWSVSQKDIGNGWTCSQGFSTEADALDYVGCLLAVGSCGQVTIDKYTPTTAELRDMDEAARAYDNDLCKASM